MANKDGRPRTYITEQDIRRAMENSNSNTAAARVLNVSFPTYRMNAKMYLDPETGKTLFDLHTNQAGKGVKKIMKNSKHPNLTDLLKEGANLKSYSIDKLKHRLLYEGIVENKCNMCGFCEERITDHRIPLLLSFKDGIKTNWNLDNLEMLCYNCYFLYIGDLYTKQQLGIIEDFGQPIVEKHTPDFEIEEYFRKHFENKNNDQELGDGSEFIAKI